MTTGPEQRVFLAARIVTVCRAHPALSLLVTALTIAAAAASAYVAHETLSQPIPALIIERGSSEPAAPPRDTVIWRDETGAVYRAKVAGGRFDQFLRQQHEALEAARSELRNQTAAEIAAALKPVFDEMRARVPGYADWNFGYTTKYELMAHAIVPTFDYLSRSLDGLTGQVPPKHETLVQTIGAHMTAYLEQQYAERVVQPRQAEIRLQAAFDKTYGALRARWLGVVGEQRRALRAFIDAQAGSAERLWADQAKAASLKLDWDGSNASGSAMHKDRVIEKSFRRGLLSLRLTIAKSVKAQDEPNTADNPVAEADEINHVIVNLFDKMVGPVVSQMGDLAIGVFAGGVASGTTVGMGMAGLGPMGLATGLSAAGLATAVPIGGAIGLVATVVAEMLSNRLEEALNRDEFEENIRKTVDATENAVQTKMSSVLDDHVGAWYADIVNPAGAK